jgi:hypothetical protein
MSNKGAPGAAVRALGKGFKQVSNKGAPGAAVRARFRHMGTQ